MIKIVDDGYHITYAKRGWEQQSVSEKTRILIADDHTVVRAGLRTLLTRRESFEVVGEAANGEEAVTQAKALRPDIVVLDIRMPGISGIEACRQIVEALPECKVIMLTSYAEDALLFAAVKAGAAGYVLKEIGNKELVQAIDRVARGEEMLNSELAVSILDEMRGAREAKRAVAFADLTPQELLVLALVAEGMTNRQIAKRLFLGEGTVRNYVSSVLAKINVANRAEAAAYAVEHNIEEYVSLPNGEGNGR